MVLVDTLHLLARFLEREEILSDDPKRKPRLGRTRRCGATLGTDQPRFQHEHHEPVRNRGGLEGAATMFADSMVAALRPCRRRPTRKGPP